jgi:mitogen-activated protein kinase kinase kinase
VFFTYTRTTQIGSSAKPEIPSDVTSDADDFMQKTFDLDYQARPSASALLTHAWVSDPTATFVSLQNPALVPTVMINA